MTREVAEALAKQIEHDCPQCRVDGVREQQGSYVIDVRYAAQETPFEVTSREAWEQRLRDGRLSPEP
jgi:hypothetical protein